MISIRIHGRGGQGTIAAAELIALTAFYQNLYAQSLPFFGVERSGAPIQAFVRINNLPIITHSQANEPDYLIIQDDSLLSDKAIWKGLDKNTKILINTTKADKEIKKEIPTLLRKNEITVINATQIALDHLRKNIINTALLGAFSAKYGLINKDKALMSIHNKFSDKGRGTIKLNQKIFITAYEQTK